MIGLFHGNTRHQSVGVLGSEQLFEFSIERVPGCF
jgi:hypothetical protein